MTAPRPTPDAPPPISVVAGVCRMYFAFDVGHAMNLDEVQRLVGAAGQRTLTAPGRRTPERLGYLRPPLLLTVPSPPIALEGWTTAPEVECVLFEFGAVSVMYTIPLAGPGAPTGELSLEDLARLSDILYENATLLADSRRRVEALFTQIRPAVKRPQLSALVEDYAVFHLRQVQCPGDLVAAILARASLAASIVRGEPARLSQQEIDDALAFRISYSPDDLTLIDWNGALVVGNDMDDVLAVLEYANVELLEMRYLDGDLDDALERSHARQHVSGWRRLLRLGPNIGGTATLRYIAALQVDGATLFEEVNNALKLLGDQYLARVYRLASQRLHLSEWDASILRKLDTLESIYAKMNDYQTTRRLELLEWIVIILIAFEILMSFIRH